MVRDITRRVLQYYVTSCQDPDLKLTLIWSVTEISHAIQDADDSPSFQFTYKEELLGYMLVCGEQPWGPNCKGQGLHERGTNRFPGLLFASGPCLPLSI
ncbi:hypothetical protein Y1Q_0006271 [Alligator mississippiensis]|uniref:MROH2B-like HEAT-repeats domain-containing protein n=1 Tax=Alligator mississippiensis TaxID=8496 RepID=A0A151NXZ2_ALLMI|nr:hypothetical protein Y1Q_0006271 [Alligator mississippiensis]